MSARSDRLQILSTPGLTFIKSDRIKWLSYRCDALRKILFQYRYLLVDRNILKRNSDYQIHAIPFHLIKTLLVIREPRWLPFSVLPDPPHP